MKIIINVLRFNVEGIEVTCYHEQLGRENPFGDMMIFAFRNEQLYEGRSNFLFTIEKPMLQDDEFVKELVQFLITKINHVKNENKDNAMVTALMVEVEDENSRWKRNLH